MKRIIVVLLFSIAGMWANKTFAQDACKHCTIHCPPKACSCGCHHRKGGLSNTTKSILARLDKLEAQQKETEQHFVVVDGRLDDLEVQFSKLNIRVTKIEIRIEGLDRAASWSDTMALVQNYLQAHPPAKTSLSITEEKYLEYLDDCMRTNKHTRHIQNFNAVVHTVGTVAALALEFCTGGVVNVFSMGSLVRNNHSRFNGNCYSYRGHTVSQPHQVRYPATNNGGVGNGYRNFGSYNNGVASPNITNGGGY